MDRFIEAFNRTDTYQSPQLLFSFLETFLEYTDPERLGKRFRHILLGFGPYPETLQRTAEVDIVELVVTFPTQCQVDPLQHPSGCAENVIVPTQLSTFRNILLHFHLSHHSTRRIFAMAAKRLQQHLRPLLSWLFVGSMPSRTKGFVSLPAVERGSPAYVLSDLLGFLVRRLKEYPLRTDCVQFYPYFGPISFALKSRLTRP